LFGTLRAGSVYPAAYEVSDAPDRWSQLLHPLSLGRALAAPRDA